jgi:hypothetical protein
MRVSALVALAGLLFVSCSTARPQDGDLKIGTANELNSEQIRASDARDALELVQRLRPLWLKPGSPRSVNAPNTILVYLNDTRLGGIEMLRGVPLETITKINYLSASEAANKLVGTGSTVLDGAIVISTIRR